MKITALKQQVKNPQRVSVFVDGKYSFSLSLDEILAEKLKTDLQIDEPRLKKLKRISEDGKLRARALEWLINRPHSTRELRDHLRRKKVGSELADKLVSEFTAKKYLNDSAYAKWLCELRGRAGKSNRAIRSELFAKGVSREVIDEVLSESSDETQRLKILITKKQKQPRYKNDELKLKQYLVRQGFSYQMVNNILKNT